MALREVIHYGHPTLRKKAKPIKRLDSVIRSLAYDMIETMHEENGVGLAAPQVNVSLRLIVFDLSTKEINLEPVVLLNPKIVGSSEDESEMEEGCLSIPGVHHNITRAKNVTVEAENLYGKEVIIENAEGLLARVLQHEIDHLNGVLFIDHLDDMERSKIKASLKKLEKETKRNMKRI